MKENSITFFLIWTLINLSFSSSLLSTNLISEIKIGKPYSLYSSNENSWNIAWDTSELGYSLGIDSLGNILLITSNYYKFFIVKVNGTGVELWKESFYLTTYHYYDIWMANDLSIDSLDNIYTVGYWESYLNYYYITYDL